MSRQLAALAEKTLLLPANVIRGLPLKTATGELVVAKPSPLGKRGFRNFWPPEYSKPPHPRLPPFPETWAQRFRIFPFQFYWEYDWMTRLVMWSAILSFMFLYWVDKKTFARPEVKEVLTNMVLDDLREQRRLLYAHDQKHEDHAYFRHKGCHDGHPLGHGVSDPHIF